MPFGLRTAHSTFQRVTDSVLGTLKEQACVVYMDIVVIRSTPEERLQNVDQVLSRLYEALFRLNLEKFQFGATSIPYLKYRICTDGIQPLPERIAAVVNYPTPTHLKEIQSFLGVASHLRKFVPYFFSTAASLTDLTKKNARFVWGATQQDAFVALKQQLTRCPVLSHFNEDWATEVHTDPSGVGLGVVLIQRDPAGKDHVVAYASRKLSDTERHYHCNELACLAVVWSVDDKCRHYVFGREFTLVTDNAAMTWMFAKRRLKHKFARWVITLQDDPSHRRIESGGRCTLSSPHW